MWNNQYARLLASFIAGIIIGSLGYWLVVRGTPNAGPVDSTQTSSESDLIVRTANSITVGNQLAGSKVEATGLNFTDSSWIAVRDDVDGKPGPRVLGAGLVNPGTETATIELLRDTVAGKSYFVQVYKDNGDRKYNSKTDEVVNDENGQSITVQFNVGTVSPDSQAETTTSAEPL